MGESKFEYDEKLNEMIEITTDVYGNEVRLEVKPNTKTSFYKNSKEAEINKTDKILSSYVKFSVKLRLTLFIITLLVIIILLFLSGIN